MPLPPCAGPYATLPPRDDPYQATLDEIESHFVDGAPEPTRARRALIMRALRLHVDVVRAIADKRGIPHPRILLDGGFITWKETGPRDADMVYLTTLDAYATFTADGLIPLWTLSEVSATLGGGGGAVTTAELRAGFGLTDCYIDVATPINIERWRRTWTAVRDPETGLMVDGAQKGFIEVVIE